MSKNPVLFRRRLIPQECVQLKDDEILDCSDTVIITKWNALKPRKDLHHGYSCYFLKEGFKVSKFYAADDTLLYWYCDIVDYAYEEDNRLIVTDLLADVLIYPNGFVKIADIDELVTGLDEGLLSVEQLKKALLRLDRLLQIIYRDKFDTLSIYIEDIEKNAGRKTGDTEPVS